MNNKERLRKLLEDAWEGGAEWHSNISKYQKHATDRDSYINSQLAAIDDIADEKGELLWQVWCEACWRQRDNPDSTSKKEFDKYIATLTDDQSPAAIDKE